MIRLHAAVLVGVGLATALFGAGLASAHDGPEARLIAPAVVRAGEPVTFNGAQSGGDLARYSWRFGDGDAAAGAVVTHAFAAPGTYVVTLDVTDTALRDAIASMVITVVEGPDGPTPRAGSPDGPVISITRVEHD